MVFRYFVSGVLVIVVTMANGCASNASLKDTLLEMSGRTKSVASAPFQRPASEGIENLARVIDSGSTMAKLEAVQTLGQMATRGDYGSVELLTELIQSKQEMSVRVAATNALGAIRDPRANEAIEAYVPTTDLSAETPSRLSLLKSTWRR